MPSSAWYPHANNTRLKYRNDKETSSDRSQKKKRLAAGTRPAKISLTSKGKSSTMNRSETRPKYKKPHCICRCVHQDCDRKFYDSS